MPENALLYWFIVKQATTYAELPELPTSAAEGELAPLTEEKKKIAFVCFLREDPTSERKKRK